MTSEARGLMDVAEFLLARIAEEAAEAQKCMDEVGSLKVGDRYEDGTLVEQADYPSYPYGSQEAELPFMARWDPARVLAECEAKRRVVELHAPVAGDAGSWRGLICGTCGSGEPYEYPTPWPCTTIKLLALPCADHSDYREEWRV